MVVEKKPESNIERKLSINNLNFSTNILNNGSTKEARIQLTLAKQCFEAQKALIKALLVQKLRIEAL